MPQHGQDVDCCGFLNHRLSSLLIPLAGRAYQRACGVRISPHTPAFSRYQKMNTGFPQITGASNQGGADNVHFGRTQRYGPDQAFVNGMVNTGAGDRLNANLQYDIASMRNDTANRALDSTLGMYQQAYGGQGGFSTGLPNSIYSPQQIQQQVNQGVNSNNSQLATNLLQSGQGMSAGGFSQNSPLYQALQAQLASSTAADNSQVRMGVPMQAAEANAGYGLQWESMRQNSLNQQAARQNSLMQSLLAFGR